MLTSEEGWRKSLGICVSWQRDSCLLWAAHIDPLGSLYLEDFFRFTYNGFILKEKNRPCHFSSASQGSLDIQCIMLSNGCQHRARPARPQWMSLLYFLHPPMFAPKNLEPGLVTRETALVKLCLFTSLFSHVEFPVFLLCVSYLPSVLFLKSSEWFGVATSVCRRRDNGWLIPNIEVA